MEDELTVLQEKERLKSLPAFKSNEKIKSNDMPQSDKDYFNVGDIVQPSEKTYTNKGKEYEVIGIMKKKPYYMYICKNTKAGYTECFLSCEIERCTNE